MVEYLKEIKSVVNVEIELLDGRKLGYKHVAAVRYTDHILEIESGTEIVVYAIGNLRKFLIRY